MVGERFAVEQEDLRVTVSAKNRKGEELRTYIYGDFLGTLTIKYPEDIGSFRKDYYDCKVSLDGELKNVRFGRKRYTRKKGEK